MGNQQQKIDAPAPGTYEDIPAEEYFRWDAVSNSRLGLLKRSAAHYRAGFANESSPAMRLGTFLHAGVLEPRSLAKHYVFQPDYSKHEGNVTASGARSHSKSTTFVKNMEEQFRSLHHDKVIVSEPEYEMLLGVMDSLETNPNANDRLRAGGQAEVSIVWDDEKTGLRCKARIDYLAADDGFFLDFKTTRDALDFERSIGTYGYHRQTAFYQDGLAALGMHDFQPWILACETTAPFGCRCAPMNAAALDFGRDEIRQLLQQLAECYQADSWPGYSDPESWGLPQWMARQRDAESVDGWFSALAEGAN